MLHHFHLQQLTEEFMVSRTRDALQYRDSRDPKVAAAGLQVRTGRRWTAGKTLDVAESRKGRAGIGYFPPIRVGQAKGKERQHLIQEEVGAERESSGQVRLLTGWSHHPFHVREPPKNWRTGFAGPGLTNILYRENLFCCVMLTFTRPAGPWRIIPIAPVTPTAV